MFGKTFIFLLGALSSYAVSSYALTLSAIDSIIDEQLVLQEYTGDFQPNVKDPSLQIHTYEAPCKGFVIIEDTPTKTEYIGYGDLAGDYTYTVNKPFYDNKPSTTPEVILDIPLDVGSTTEFIAS